MCERHCRKLITVGRGSTFTVSASFAFTFLCSTFGEGSTNGCGGGSTFVKSNMFLRLLLDEVVAFAAIAGCEDDSCGAETDSALKENWDCEGWCAEEEESDEEKL